MRRGLDDPQIHVGMALRGAGGRERGGQGLGGLDMEGDDELAPTHGVGGQAGIVATVYKVGGRDGQLRQNCIGCSGGGQHWGKEERNSWWAAGMCPAMPGANNHSVDARGWPPSKSSAHTLGG